MRILNRYLARSVINGTLLVLTVFVLLVSFFSLIEELGDAGRGSYGTLQAIQYTLLSVPQRIYELLPVSALLGSLLGLGGLASHNELVAMRAAGVSVTQVILAALRAGFLLLAFSVLLGEFVAPPAQQLAQSIRAGASTKQITVRTNSGYWARDGNRFVNIETIAPGAILHGIRIYEFDAKQRLAVATYAHWAGFRDGRWFLREVKQTHFHEDWVEVQQHRTLEWWSPLEPDLLRVVTVKPENLSAVGLYEYIRYLKDNELEADRYELAFWDKVLQPVNLFVMLYLAIPFVFGPLRSVSIGQRIFVGVLIGVAFYLSSEAVGQMGLVYEFDPLASQLLPSIIFLLFAIYGVRRVR